MSRIERVQVRRRSFLSMSAAGIVLSLSADIALAENQQDCKDRWLKAESAGIVYGVGMVAGVPTASVDEDAFMSVDFSTKTGFAETLNCAAVGPDRFLAEIVFVSHRTNKRLARWTPFKGLTVD